MMSRYLTNNTLRYALFFIAVLPAFMFRDFTPDNESRYISIADEALRNGTIFTFADHGIIYADKPPLYLWVVMFGKWLFGYHNLLFLGLFSYAPALVVLYIMDKWVKKILSERERLMAQLMLLTSVFFIGTAIVLRMDMLMSMFIVLALYTFFKMYIGEGKPRDAWLFPFFIFMAIFTKGPIGIIVPLISTIVFLFIKGKIRTVGKYWGWKTLAILLTFCTIWFGGVYAEGGSQYLDDLLFNQTIHRAVNSFHHKEPFYYYFMAFWYSLAPWSILIAGILIAGLKRKLAATDLGLFFLVIAFSTIATLSLFSSKLAVYMLPSIPFFVYLSAMWLAKLGSPRWMFLFAGIPAGILILIFPGVIVASQLPKINEVGISPLVFISCFILSGSGILTFRLLKKQELNKAIISLGTGILISVFVVSFAIPRYNKYIGLQEICNQAKETASEKGGVNYYYCEMTIADNLNAYLGVMPEKLRISDLYKADSSMKTPAILFTWHKAIERNDSLRVFLKDKKIHQSGGNFYIEIDRKK